MNSSSLKTGYYFVDNYYGGKASVYNAMKTWARLIYPPDFNVELTSDPVSSKLLFIMSGIPIGQGKEMRIFLKAVACNLLANHLIGNTVDINTAKHLQDYYYRTFQSFNTKRLTA